MTWPTSKDNDCSCPARGTDNIVHGNVLNLNVTFFSFVVGPLLQQTTCTYATTEVVSMERTRSTIVLVLLAKN
jgi:hypothetical protein